MQNWVLFVHLFPTYETGTSSVWSRPPPGGAAASLNLAARDSWRHNSAAITHQHLLCRPLSFRPESNAFGAILGSGEVRGPWGDLQPLVLRHGGPCRCENCKSAFDNTAIHHLALFYTTFTAFCCQKNWNFTPENAFSRPICDYLSQGTAIYSGASARWRVH